MASEETPEFSIILLIYCDSDYFKDGRKKSFDQPRFYIYKKK